MWVDTGRGTGPVATYGCKRRCKDLLRSSRLYQAECASLSGRDHTEPTQMANANNEARRALHAGKFNLEALQDAKSVGSSIG